MNLYFLRFKNLTAMIINWDLTAMIINWDLTAMIINWDNLFINYI
jgi:hypothetical protein